MKSCISTCLYYRTNILLLSLVPTQGLKTGLVYQFVTMSPRWSLIQMKFVPRIKLYYLSLGRSFRVSLQVNMIPNQFDFKVLSHSFKKLRVLQTRDLCHRLKLIFIRFSGYYCGVYSLWIHTVTEPLRGDCGRVCLPDWPVGLLTVWTINRPLGSSFKVFVFEDGYFCIEKYCKCLWPPFFSVIFSVTFRFVVVSSFLTSWTYGKRVVRVLSFS